MINYLSGIYGNAFK